MPEARPDHWIVRIARQLGGGDPDVEVGPRAPIEQIWTAAVHIAGVGAWEIAKAGARHLGLEIADLDDIEPRAMKLVPEKLARSACIFPLREDDRTLMVATPDPTDLNVEEELRFVSGRRPVFQVAPPGDIMDVIEANYRPDSMVEDLLSHIDSEDQGVHVVGGEAPDLEVADASTEPVVKLSNLILRDGVNQRASDIHLAPGRGVGTVRLRVDGVLRLQMRLPMPVFHRIVSRIKVLGSMDISDRLRPQDGRARIRVEDQFFDLRISTVPTRSAEKAVIRILYTDEAPDLDELGMAPRELERFRRMLANRDSIIFVTGPTGSGKTTTLYAALRELTTGDVNIMTVEDPIEYELEGVTQIQVERKRGVTFASSLRAILRQDPDIILLGEIRDQETAEIAVQAAQTGHLVLATLHTNDALGVVPRLADLGLAHRSIADSLCGMVAQRLVRLACPDCAAPLGNEDELDAEEARLAAAYGVRPRIRAIGCTRCADLGYRGRRPVLETVLTTTGLQALIGDNASSQALREAAIRGGLRPLHEAALDLVKEGLTTLQEVDRALGETAEPDVDRVAAVEQSPHAEGPPTAPEGNGGPAPAAAPALSAEDPAPAGPGGDKPGATDDRPLHILMADDDVVVRELARAVLEKNGFRFSGVDDGVAALERLNQDDDVDLMVLDLNMPRLGGTDVLRLARSSPRTAALPVVVLTGSASDETEIALMESGADDYLRKPLEPSRFIARIRAVLRRSGGPA